MESSMYSLAQLSLERKNQFDEFSSLSVSPNLKTSTAIVR